MSSKLYTYSLIRAFYNTENDFIDSFWSLIVKEIPIDQTGISVPDIQNKTNENSGLFIPVHSLNTIFTRAARKGYVERRDKRIYLTSSGKEFYYSKIEPSRDVERRVNEMLEDAQKYIKTKHQTDVSSDDIKNTVQDFVLDNLEVFEPFFSKEVQAQSPFQSKKQTKSDLHRWLLDYFKEAEKKKPNIFRTLQDIVLGSVMTAIVKSQQFLTESEKKFEAITVFLDSNFLFSLLDMRYPEENKPAQELFELMKSEGSFTFKVFDFTIHEMTTLLSNFEKEQKNLPKNLKLSGASSLFASLKAQNWDAAKIREFIIDVELNLAQRFGITIQPTNVSLKSYKIDNPERIQKLTQYKTKQSSAAQNHDFAAIDQIRLFRRGQARRIENCQALFLTSDVRLAIYNYNEEEHRERGTISEVILDRLLTNILWLKNPAANGKLSLDLIIAALSKNLFIDSDVWKSFYRNVVDATKKGKIDSTTASTLLFGSHLQEILSEIDPEEPEFDLDQILLDIHTSNPPQSLISPEQVSELVAISPSTEYEAKIQQLEEKLEELANDKLKTERKTVIRWKKVMELEAERESRRYIWAIKLLIAAPLITISYFVLPLVIKYWSDFLEPVAWQISIVIGFLIALFSIPISAAYWEAKVYGWIFNRLYQRKLQKLQEKDYELNFKLDVANEEDENNSEQ
jgi:uncharacterized membrane protein (DUF485 family)